MKKMTMIAAAAALGVVSTVAFAASNSITTNFTVINGLNQKLSLNVQKHGWSAHGYKTSNTAFYTVLDDADADIWASITNKSGGYCNIDSGANLQTGQPMPRVRGSQGIKCVLTETIPNNYIITVTKS